MSKTNDVTKGLRHSVLVHDGKLIECFFQSFTGRVHRLAMFCRARYISLVAASSLGKVRRVLRIFRIERFSDSMALVV